MKIFKIENIILCKIIFVIYLLFTCSHCNAKEQQKLMHIFNVGVFCSADDKISDVNKQHAFRLGQILVENNYALITGGSKTGLMKEVVDGYVSKAPVIRVQGVMPKILQGYNAVHPDITDDNLTWTETVHQRLSVLHDKCDIVIILPGGFGTLHELMDFLVHNQYGIIKKRIVLLNIEGFWDPLLDQFKSMVEKNSLRQEHLNHLEIVSSIDECLEKMSLPHIVQVGQGFDDRHWEVK